MQNLNNVQLMLVAIVLFGISRSVVSFWDVFPEWRRPREAWKLFFLGLLVKSRRSVVLAAAWWYECVGNFSVWLAHWPTAFVGGFFPSLSFKVDSVVQISVGLLLADWLAWFIAGDYLQAKWDEEVRYLNKVRRLGVLKKG